MRSFLGLSTVSVFVVRRLHSFTCSPPTPLLLFGRTRRSIKQLKEGADTHAVYGRRREGKEGAEREGWATCLFLAYKSIYQADGEGCSEGGWATLAYIYQAVEGMFLTQFMEGRARGRGHYAVEGRCSGGGGGPTSLYLAYNIIYQADGGGRSEGGVGDIFIFSVYLSSS